MLSPRRTRLAAMLALGFASSAGAAAAPVTLHRPLSLPRSPAPVRRHASTPIQHVVFVVQENRSFNNLFMGYPGAITQSYGYDEKGNQIALHAQDLEQTWDIDHSSVAFFTDCDGTGSVPGTNCKVDGWNNEFAAPGHPSNFAYAYVPEAQIEPYWKIAKQYVLADNMFASNLDGSFIAHQYVIAAYASTAVNYPNSSWGCEGGPSDTIDTLNPDRSYNDNGIQACFDIPTIGSEADAAGLSWRFYAGAINVDGGIWSSYQANPTVFYGPDWSADVINPPSQFLTDIGNGTLANVTWITPTYENSDHPGLDGTTGPSWVASVVDAIGESPFWSSAAIFVIWDDWGGWFDPVPPPYEDYDGFGFRIPMLMISPYAKKHYVTHVQYETSSVLRYIEDNFGLPTLAASDGRANDPASDAFDYKKKPRTFKKIGGSKPRGYWIMQDRMRRYARPPAILDGD